MTPANSDILLATFLAAILLVGCTSPSPDESETNFVRGELITFTGKHQSPNGAWCWFQDERAIVDPDNPGGPTLMFTAVSASSTDSTEHGDLDLHHYGLDSRAMGTVELHDQLEQDDHNVAALYQLDSGEVLATYARHGSDPFIQSVRSGVNDPTTWSPLLRYSEDARVTYSNLLSAGTGSEEKLYNFSRSRSWNPNFVAFDSATETWKYGGRLLASEGRPYVKYQSSQDGSRIHVVATDQHPRDFDNSIYHAVFDGETLSDSFGEVLDEDLSDQDAAEPGDLTTVFQGNPDNVAWVADVEVDENDQPVIAFSVQKDGRDLPPRQGGLDHRYHLARFIDGAWVQHEIAFAGQRLYPLEDDYTGLLAIDPQDANHLVISTNADPLSGEPLISRADSLRHHELFEGHSSDGGASFTWTALTSNSTVDNIRPIIPAWESDRRIVLWMRGRYSSYTDWDTQIVGIVQERGPMDWNTPAGWVLEDSSLWSIGEGSLELERNSPFPSDIRRPGAVATVTGTENLRSFHLRAQVRSTQDTSIVGRDVILVFGYRSPSDFYYAHLSNDNTIMPHNGIFIVNQADRRRIDDQGVEGAPEARLLGADWHDVRVERDVESGTVQVYLDHLTEPLMTASDTTFRWGAVGFGSFDDTGLVRGLQWLDIIE
jgi:hypothetical protein